MPITFPSSPSNADEYTFNGRTYTYNAARGVWLGSRGGSSSAGGGGGAALTVSDTAPTSASEGDLWFHSTLLETYVYYNSQWVLSNPSGGGGGSGASLTTSDTAPATPSAGDLWFNSTDLTTYVYYDDGSSSQWVSSMPSGVTAGSSGGGGGGVTVYATIAELPLTGNTTGDQAYVSDVNRLYLWNSAGWYDIALINETPTAITGVSANYRLETDGTPTVITAVSSDPEEIPLTWSYAITSGSLGTTATISQTDNVFTITPGTNDPADVGEFDITISVTDGVNTATTTSTVRLAFVEPPNYQFHVYGVTGSTTSDSYQIDDVDTAYTGGSTISTTALSLDVSRTIQHQYLQSSSGVQLGAIDMTSATSDDFTWQFFINTSQSGAYHNVFNDNGVFNSHTFKYSNTGNWYWYNGTGYDPAAGTNHQGSNTWYHMIVQGEYSTGTIYTWIDTTYIGSSVVGQSFWDTNDLADFANMTINTTGSESYDMYIGEMKIWKGYQYYTVGQNTTWAAVFGEE